MGYKLKEIEFDCFSPQFTELRINKERIVGCNYLEASKLIHQQYRKLAPKFHPDKTGGSDEKMKVINEHKAQLLEYIKSLSDRKSSIFIEELERFYKLLSKKQGDFNDKRNGYLLKFCLVRLLLLLPYLYLGVRLFKAANFATTPGILFSATLFTAVSTFLLTAYLTVFVLEEKVLNKEIFEYKFSIFASQYTPYLSSTLLVAGLGLQYQSGCMDSKVLIGFVAVLGCILIKKLATEIYERKVVEVVKTEGMGTEQRALLAIEEPPSTTINPDSASPRSYCSPKQDL